MNIESLSYFVKIVDEKSITKASKSEHISQSALTQIVKKLESDLNCSLLSRSNKGITPTECGQLVYEYAKDMAGLYSSMQDRLVCMTEGCFSLVIKPCCSLDNQFIPNIMYQIQNKFKNVKLTTILDNKIKTISEIKIGITDFGIVMGNVLEDEVIDITIVGQEDIVLVAGPKMIVSNKISISELSKYKIIDFSLGSYMKDIHNLIESRTSPKINGGYSPFFSIDSISAIKTLVISNFGLAFLPRYSVVDELEKNQIKMIELDDYKLRLPIKILSKKDSYLPPLMIEIKKSLIKSSIKYFTSQK